MADGRSLPCSQNVPPLSDGQMMSDAAAQRQRRPAAAGRQVARAAARRSADPSFRLDRTLQAPELV